MACTDIRGVWGEIFLSLGFRFENLGSITLAFSAYGVDRVDGLGVGSKHNP